MWNSPSAQDPGQPHPRPQRTDSRPQTGPAGPRKVASASAAASTLSEPPRRTQESRTRTRALGLPMEKSAASTEPQGPRPVLGRDSVQVPDDQDFRSFRSECEAEEGWNLTYSKAGVSVWVQAVEMDRTLHKIKVRLSCPTCSLHCALGQGVSCSSAGPQTPGCAPGLRRSLLPETRRRHSSRGKRSSRRWAN